MYLLRCDKGGELVLIEESEDFEYLKDRFELEVIYMTFRGLVEKEGRDEKVMHTEFSRDNEWDCALVVASAMVHNVQK